MLQDFKSVSEHFMTLRSKGLRYMFFNKKTICQKASTRISENEESLVATKKTCFLYIRSHHFVNCFWNFSNVVGNF